MEGKEEVKSKLPELGRLSELKKLIELKRVLKVVERRKLKADLLAYKLFIAIGIFMSIGTLLKLAGLYDFSSDWFWFIAGIGLIIEGLIALLKAKRFEKKYKIVEKPIKA